ncbi:MAG: BamA/TamA family outer membrane protein [Parachlamydiales bacterium]|nr:BamA/TamA family outer membrane protein [Parachlamydiales bacterium]
MKYFFCILFCLAAASPAFAIFVGPPSSSAGIIERELEREYEAREIPPERDIPLMEIDVPEQKLDLPKGKSVEINQIEFIGNDAISSSKLQECVACFMGKPITMSDVKEICACVQSLYLKNGYFLARAFPPEQTISNKTLKIEIIEGRLGNIKVEGNCYYSSGFIGKYFLDFQDKAIQYDEMMRALLLINEYWDLNVALIFKKGKEWGKADIILRAVDSRPMHLYWDYNNYGSKITTDSRTGARFDCGNLFAYGDFFTVAQVIGFPPGDLTFTDFVYDIPLNARGTHLEASYLFSYFNIGQQRDLDLKGNAHVAELKLTHAIIRKKQYDMDVFAMFDYKNLINLVLGATSSVDRLRIFGAGISLDYSDTFYGRNVGSFRTYVGVPQFLGGSKAIDPMCSREGAGGRFTHFNLDVKRIQQLGGNYYFLFNFSGQLSLYKLPLGEQMYIGGFDTVRGYQLAAALGDHGYCVSGEFRLPIPGLSGKCVHPKLHKTWDEFIQFVAFFDHGGVFLNGGGEDQNRRIYLTGTGPGVRIFGPWHINLTFDIGFPLTHTFETSNPFYYFKASIDFF